jgi:hypothetical protein
MTQQVLEAISFLSPLSRLCLALPHAVTENVQMLACPKSDATRISVFPSAISVIMGCESVVRRVVTDGLTLKMTALQSFETSAADRLTTQHNPHETPL